MKLEKNKDGKDIIKKWPGDNHPEAEDRFGFCPEGYWDELIGRRRDEAYTGEFMPGVLADSDEEFSEYEYFDYELPPVAPVEEYQVYRWAKVDCDIED